MAQKFHIDKRAAQLLNDTGSDDDLLDTREVAAWFGVSIQWLETGRSLGYGPKFTRLAARTVRYTRGNCRAYLKARTYAHTGEYEAVEA